MGTAVAASSAASDERARVENLLAELSSRFINLPPDQVDGEIAGALSRVSEELGIDSAVLWQWSVDSPDLILPTHVHPPVPAERRFDPLSQDAYPWVYRQMRAGRIVQLARLDEAPSDAATDVENARAAGIRSNLTLPMYAAGGVPVGALAFNAVGRERTWHEPQVKRLQVVAEVFSNALARKRADLALRASEALNRATFTLTSGSARSAGCLPRSREEAVRSSSG